MPFSPGDRGSVRWRRAALLFGVGALAVLAALLISVGVSPSGNPGGASARVQRLAGVSSLSTHPAQVGEGGGGGLGGGSAGLARGGVEPRPGTGAGEGGRSALAAPISARALGASPLAEALPGGPRTAIASERALQSGVSLVPSTSEPHWACPQGVCEAIVDPPPHFVDGHWTLPDSARALEGGGEKGGFDPTDLRSAYSVSITGSEAQQHYEEKQTIALVDAAYVPEAESDLAEYRKHYGLPECKKAGGCFHQVNQEGEEGNPPPTDPEWDLETALDLDMASAMCPHCHILLVEATAESLTDLAESANTAARLGATEISNSYGLPEQESHEVLGGCGESDCQELDSDYNHPGVVVTASAGDAGYDNYLRDGTSPLFPGVSSTVITVGGTALRKTKEGRKWSESVWWEPERSLGTGSGCSSLRTKPPWQTDAGCAHRTDNDVAAVGACETPVSIYSTAYGGWENVCGTSVGSPLVAGIEAHANEAGGAVPTADAFYQRRSSLYDVTKGKNDTTCSPSYLCDAETPEAGYDGPAGNGTPASGPVVVASEPPTARTQPATEVKKGEVRLNGLVDPNGAETSYRFEYGPTTSYGKSVPVPEGSVGTSSLKEVSQTVTVTEPGIYHYRVAATNSVGTVHGEDATFAYGPGVTAVHPPTEGRTAAHRSRSRVSASRKSPRSSSAPRTPRASPSTRKTRSRPSRQPARGRWKSPSRTRSGRARRLPPIASPTPSPSRSRS